ncbi:ETS variant transcription factor 2 [Phyllostomus discolor]|uniref:ETS variant transcription factor 2 n=1 Tax=Phyllostomus discolor TaxID=89673 RepID=A0A833YNC7_9CHIR|nr:ETS variant transcription factor 2 [Phyllostomus discolor]
MDLWKWDEASPQEGPPGNRLSRLEDPELSFYFPEVALQGDMLTEEPCWKGFPQQDWGSTSPHPETPQEAEHACQAFPWSGDWSQLGCPGWDSWSPASPALGPTPPGLGPAPFAGSLGITRQNTSLAGGLILSHHLGHGVAYRSHQVFEGVPEFRFPHFLRTEPAVGPRNFSSLPQN